MEDSNQTPAIREEKQTMRFIGDVGPLFDALAKAQAEFVEMDRDAQVAFDRRTFKYATLAEVLVSVRPALNKYGLALLQPFDGDKVTTILAMGAARIEVDAYLLGWTTPQLLGSQLTYVKRYQVKSLLGVNDGEDDDGNEASGTGKVPEPRNRTAPPVPAAKPASAAKATDLTPETKAKIGALGREAGLNKEDLQAIATRENLGTLEGLGEASGAKLVAALEAMKVRK